MVIISVHTYPFDFSYFRNNRGNTHYSYVFDTNNNVHVHTLRIDFGTISISDKSPVWKSFRSDVKSEMISFRSPYPQHVNSCSVLRFTKWRHVYISVTINQAQFTGEHLSLFVISKSRSESIRNTRVNNVNNTIQQIRMCEQAVSEWNYSGIKRNP